MINDKNNRRKNPSQESEDLLGMIRKRQEQSDTDESSNSKLREFLNNLPEETCELDYRESPLYKMGYEDAFNEAEELFNDKLRNIRRTLKNLLTHC